MLAAVARTGEGRKHAAPVLAHVRVGEKGGGDIGLRLRQPRQDGPVAQRRSGQNPAYPQRAAVIRSHEIGRFSGDHPVQAGQVPGDQIGLRRRRVVEDAGFQPALDIAACPVLDVQELRVAIAIGQHERTQPGIERVMLGRGPLLENFPDGATHRVGCRHTSGLAHQTFYPQLRAEVSTIGYRPSPATTKSALRTKWFPNKLSHNSHPGRVTWERSASGPAGGSHWRPSVRRRTAPGVGSPRRSPAFPR